jgi:predicted ABC-type ATPase
MPPELFVLAGPNGIGKTTSSFDIIPAQIPIINSDEIANAARNSGMTSVSTQEYSNREAIKLMNGYLEKRESLAIETNLADLDTWKFLLETQKQGFSINVIYLSTDSLELLNDRIEARVLESSHWSALQTPDN